MRFSLIRRGLDNPRLNPRNIEYFPRVSYKSQIFWGAVMLAVSYVAGNYIERHEMNRMRRFRDKSALFGSEKGPNDEPSWGDKESDIKFQFSKWPRSWWY